MRLIFKLKFIFQSSEVLTEVLQVLFLSQSSPEFNLCTPSTSFPVRKSKRLVNS